ncbi:hypothetical protein DERF_008230 [Dermatophagoides farinae]|uniref:Uncharacterized protein n=1 Tax=Dermatophagoides farinae TaxID=6954 RepID=A0A922I2Z6_DERFA|nr:hypothetical protein DERF_008230 [Dermatophagoides farinae]
MSSTFTVPVIGQNIDLRINNKPTMVIDAKKDEKAISSCLRYSTPLSR